MKTILWLGAGSESEAVRGQLQVRGRSIATRADAGAAAELLVIEQRSDEPADSVVLDRVCKHRRALVIASSPELRREALRRGAYYVASSLPQPGELVMLVERALSVPQPPAPTPSAIGQVLVGESPPMLNLRSVLQRLQASPHTAVLIKGEPGSGKRTLARALHLESRRPGEFLELTGPRGIDAIRRGRGETRPATIYLGDLAGYSAPLQGRLQRLMENWSGETAPPRFIATVSGDVQGAIRSGDLRPALLNRFPVSMEVPPLRDRPDDIPLLAYELAARAARRHGLALPQLGAGVLCALRERSWPGNVRELANTLESAVLQTHGAQLEVSHLPSSEPAGVQFRLPACGVDLDGLERDVLAQALRLAQGNRTRAASLLGLTRDQVRYRLAKLEHGEGAP